MDRFSDVVRYDLIITDIMGRLHSYICNIRMSVLISKINPPIIYLELKDGVILSRVIVKRDRIYD